MIRPATLSDAELIASLTRQAWANTAPIASSGHTETAERVREDLELGGGLVLEVEGVAVGSVRWFPDLVADAWEVMRLGIRPAFRGGGWGRALMDEGARLARAAAIPELRIFVEDGQAPLVVWYERQGFFVGETPAYARNGTATPPVMLRKLLRANRPDHHQRV